MRVTLRFGCCGTIAAAAWAPMALGAVSTFDSTNDGWFIANVAPSAHIAADPGEQSLPWDSGNGLGPGSVRVGDVFGETWIGAPAGFLGDQSAHLGESVSCDIFVRFRDAASYGAFALRGASITLYVQLSAPPVDEWSHMSVPLVEGDWRVNGENSATFATEAQILAVLSDLRGFYIRTEWRTGPDDTSVDNPRIGSAPPPACVGDINGDNATNAADFTILAGAFGTTVTPNTSGDLNGDGLVNAADFVILAGDFGCGSP